MTVQEIRDNLKIGDSLVDLDNTDRDGLGLGKVLAFYDGWMTVHFEKKKLPIFVSDGLISYDRQGAAKRCKLIDELSAEEIKQFNIKA